MSLVELVIVVVILGIIAAIAVPRMTAGAAGAGESALKHDLAVLRKAIDIYAAEHDGDHPGARPDGQGGSANSSQAFVNQLTMFSSPTGAVSDTRDGVHRFGPYLRGIPPLPVGANKGGTTVAIDASNSPPLVTTGSEGWVYNPTTGEIIANSDDANRAGTRAFDEF